MQQEANSSARQRGTPGCCAPELPPSAPVGAPRRLRILILCFKDLTANTRVVRQAQALAARGHAVTVFSLSNPDAALVNATPDVQFIETGRIDLTYPTIFLLAGRVPGLIRFCGRVCRRLWADTVHQLFSRRFHFALLARRRFRGEKYDIILVHDHHSVFAAVAVDPRGCAVTVLDAVEAPYHKGLENRRGVAAMFRRVEIAFERRALRRAKHCFTVGHSLARLLRKNGYGPDIEVIRNTRKYEPPISHDRRLRSDTGFPKDSIIALLLSTVYAGQGLEPLIDALPKVDAAVHLAVLGKFIPPGFRDEVAERAHGLGVGERVAILPVVPPATLVPYISGADFGVIPLQKSHLNNSISLPNRVFEMLMARLPLAVCTIDDIRGIVETHDVGVVFRETDVNDIARKLNHLAEPENRRRYRINLDSAARILNWENEGLRFAHCMESYAQVSGRK